jgi:hypothetical protein
MTKFFSPILLGPAPGLYRLTGLDDIRDPATNASSFDVLVALRNGLPA